MLWRLPRKVSRGTLPRATKSQDLRLAATSKSLRPRGPDTIRPAEPHPTLVVAIATPFGSDEIHRCSFDAHHPSLGGNASFGETQALGSSNLPSIRGHAV